MPGEEKKSFLLRLDPALWDTLEKWAADELRSVNGQIEWILREAARRRFGAKRLEGRGPKDGKSQDDRSRDERPRGEKR